MPNPSTGHVPVADGPYAAELAFALELARIAGPMIPAGAPNRAVRWKSDGSEVTDVDEAINTLVIERVAFRFPTHRILGEEASLAGPAGAPVWVVDPIDGTFPYRAGIGLACFSLALVVDGDPVVAVVADPWTDTLWWARRGSGTYRNGVRCRVSSMAGLNGAGVCVEAVGGPQVQSRLIESLMTAGSRVVTYFAAVRAGTGVADGGLEAVCYGHGKPWDVAATTLLVREAGGIAGCVDNSGSRYDGPIGPWLAAAPGVWDHAAAAWRACGCVGC